MTNLFLHHLRRGFATNCSSAHSLLFLPGAKDDLSNVRDGVYDFDFVLASREAKLPYLRMELEAADGLDDEIAAELGLPPVGGQEETGYQWTAPPELAREIARWALKDGVVALGGPNYAEYHPLANSRRAIDPNYFDEYRIRRDPLGFWTLLDFSGALMRLSFGEAAHPQVQPFRSTWPELVDLKITDRCEAGCAFCYQDSRPDGEHAPLEDVLARLDELKKAQVLEVVLGGGEPTGHPEFARIVLEIQQRGMHAAFTTRRLDWEKEVARGGADWSRVHWAFSLTRPHEIGSVLDRRHRTRPAIHVVMGTECSRPENLRTIARKCADRWLTLVLLGFKATGRAAGMTPLDDAHWLDTCAAAGIRQVAIDAVLARKYDLELQRRGIPDWLYDVEDGRYAMHVDAVRGTCGPSSFCPPEEMFAIPGGEDPIKEAFDRINERLGPARLHRALELEQDRVRDEKALVMLDAAMEGRCEVCAAAGATPVGGARGRPRLLCPACRDRVGAR